MKCNDIHKGLPDSELRDFLSRNMRHGFSGEAEHLRTEIKALQKRLKKAENYSAACRLAESQGWVEYDISDEVEDYSSEGYFSFLGTQEERDNFELELSQQD